MSEDNDIVHDLFLTLAGLFTIACCLVTFLLIFCHLINYNKPSHQKLVIRILLISPIYAVDSWFSLYYKRYYWGIFIVIARDCYEAYVLYCFFKLLCCYLGGEEAINALVIKKERQPVTFPLCCFTFQPGRRFYITSLQSLLQYAIIKPTLAVVAAILFLFHKYEDANFSADSGYLYITIINNISVLIALFYLVMFYEVLQVELDPHKPVLKFLVIKGIIFFTFWQSVVIYILIWFNVIPSTQKYSQETIGYFINDFLVCFEMFLATITHAFAFSHYDYKLSNSKDNLVDRDHKGGIVEQFKNIKYNIRRYKSDIVRGVVDVHKDKEIVLDTIKSVKKTRRSKSRTPKYHNFVDLTTPGEFNSDAIELDDGDDDEDDNENMNIDNENDSVHIVNINDSNNKVNNHGEINNNNNSSYFTLPNNLVNNNNNDNRIDTNDLENGMILQ